MCVCEGITWKVSFPNLKRFMCLFGVGIFLRKKKWKKLLFKVIFKVISQKCVRVGDESNIGFYCYCIRIKKKMDKRQGWVCVCLFELYNKLAIIYVLFFFFRNLVMIKSLILFFSWLINTLEPVTWFNCQVNFIAQILETLVRGQIESIET